MPFFAKFRLFLYIGLLGLASVHAIAEERSCPQQLAPKSPRVSSLIVQMKAGRTLSNGEFQTLASRALQIVSSESIDSGQIVEILDSIDFRIAADSIKCSTDYFPAITI